MYRTEWEYVGPHLSKVLGGVGWRGGTGSRVLGSWMNTGWEIPSVASEPGGNVKIKDLTPTAAAAEAATETLQLCVERTHLHIWRMDTNSSKLKMMMRRVAGLHRRWTSCQEVTTGCLPFSHWCSLHDYSETLRLSLFLAHKDIKLVWQGDFSKILPKLLSWKSQCCLPCYYPCLFSSQDWESPLPDF